MPPELAPWIPPAVIVGVMLYLHRSTRQDMKDLCAVRSETSATAWDGSKAILTCSGSSSWEAGQGTGHQK